MTLRADQQPRSTGDFQACLLEGVLQRCGVETVEVGFLVVDAPDASSGAEPLHRLVGAVGADEFDHEAEQRVDEDAHHAPGFSQAAHRAIVAAGSAVYCREPIATTASAEAVGRVDVLDAIPDQGEVVVLERPPLGTTIPGAGSMPITWWPCSRNRRDQRPTPQPTSIDQRGRSCRWLRCTLPGQVVVRPAVRRREVILVRRRECVVQAAARTSWTQRGQASTARRARAGCRRACSAARRGSARSCCRSPCSPS